MSETFETRTIEESLGTLIDYRGKTPPKTESGVRLVTAKVIKDGYVQDHKEEFIAADFYDEWMRRGLPKQWDIVITTEAPLGEVAQLRTAEKVALAQRVILLRTNPDVYDQSFFFQALKGDYVQGGLKARGTGTTVLGIKQSELRKVNVPWFPLPTQRKIASILSAYDDLIENNTRRIAILEEMAQAIYREWFVNFRFPGHENVKLVDSPLGQIPEGWEPTTWGELVTLEYGKGLRGYQDAEGPVPVYGTNGPIGFHDVAICDRAGIIIGRKGAYRGVEYSDVPFWVIDTAFYLNPTRNALDIIWAYYTLLDLDINKMDSGSAIPSTSRDAFYAVPVVLPADKVTTTFRNIVDDLMLNCRILHRKSKNLRTTCDLLLPKLIAGKLDVEDLDIDVGQPLEELEEATA